MTSGSDNAHREVLTDEQLESVMGGDDTDVSTPQEVEQRLKRKFPA